MFTSLYFFGKKENWTWVKDVLFDAMDDSIDFVAAIDEFASINEDNAASVLDGFVDNENDNWDLIFWSKSLLCVILLKILFGMRMTKKWTSHFWVYYFCFVWCLL